MADCPICSKPLAVGTSVVYKGDQLIHAGCWGDKPDAPGKPTSTEGRRPLSRPGAQPPSRYRDCVPLKGHGRMPHLPQAR
jgi:hypothetical protein